MKIDKTYYCPQCGAILNDQDCFNLFTDIWVCVECRSLLYNPQKLEKFPCPICGTKCLTEEYGSYEICLVCGWEEDGIQQDYPDEAIGPNKDWSLNSAKAAWKRGETLFPRYPNPKSRSS